MKTRTGRRRVRSMAEEYVPAADSGEPYHHGHDLRVGDTLIAFGQTLRIVSMVGTGMPTHQIALAVEPVRGVEGGGGGGG